MLSTGEGLDIYNLISFVGLFLLLGICRLLSASPEGINWRTVGTGVLLMFGFALFLFLLPFGSIFFSSLNSFVASLLQSAQAGEEFLFGRLALAPGTTNAAGETSLGFILAIQALPTVVFFAALVQLLYYYGILPRIIAFFSKVFTKLMRISGAESLCVSANIFVGVEAGVSIRPHLEKMTQSELFTILTAGMATIASSMLAFYVFILHEQFPMIAGHLVSASLLSAPAAIIVAKILVPETETPETLGEHISPHYDKENNPVEAIVKGANSGLQLVIGMIALLLAFLGLLALADVSLATAGEWLNSITGFKQEWSLKAVLTWIFLPFTLLMGVPLNDAMEVSRIVGERLVVTEVQSYFDLKTAMENGLLQHPRSAVICTYALCGFAHVASMAIFTGALSALAPSRLSDISRLAPKALLSATFACLLTGAMAGIFFTSSSLLLSTP